MKTVFYNLKEIHYIYLWAYLGFGIAGAKKNSPVFLIDHFLYTVSTKPILSVINLIKYTYQHQRKFLFF
jgi:hypothetical protein